MRDVLIGLAAALIVILMWHQSGFIPLVLLAGLFNIRMVVLLFHRLSA